MGFSGSTTENAVSIFNRLASEYQSKFMDVGLYGESLDCFCDNIPQENPDILELACGPGNITKYLLEKRSDFMILGTDLAPNMLALAKANNPGAEFMLMDCREVGGLDKRYDGVMCGFCLPYLSREEAVKLIGDASWLLKPNGVLYLSTMEDDYGKSGIQRSSAGDEMYMYFHQADYLTTALDGNGFKVIDLQRKVYPGRDGETTTDLLIVASLSV